MEVFLRLLQLVVKLIYAVVHPLLNWLLPRNNPNAVPPIRNQLLSLALVDVVEEMRQLKLTSVKLTEAYIERIQEVNPLINAVVEERFAEALKQAQQADDLFAKAAKDGVRHSLVSRYPLLGVPFSVKESCGVKGLSHVVGSLQRVGIRSADNGDVVENLRAAGAIPLLVSANPEYCFSIETNTYTNGKCLNPYDTRRTAGGSSGGEGALNGAGASLFGVGSDIAGSIRLPSLFNGVFGHKPTGGSTSVKGLFPGSGDAVYGNYLQVGPITRFGRDLGLLMHIMAGANAEKLDLLSRVETKSIKVYYSLGYDGLNGHLHHAVAYDTQFAIMQAVKFFAQKGLKTQRVHIQGFRNSTEIAMTAISRLEDFPFLINTSSTHKILENLWEFMKSLCGKSNYTKDGLIFELLRRTNSFMSVENAKKYIPETQLLKEEILTLLGPDGVLFFPTFPVPAVHHNSSILPLWAIDYTLIFNVLGLPATHIPMGLTTDTALPVGFQVVAAPFKDKLCLQIAGELETAFGGWKGPTTPQL